jgi:hypothetical protein
LKPGKGQPLAALPGLQTGILFCTYDLLISGAKALPKQPKKRDGAKGEGGGEAAGGSMSIVAAAEAAEAGLSPEDEFGE